MSRENGIRLKDAKASPHKGQGEESSKWKDRNAKPCSQRISMCSRKTKEADVDRDGRGGETCEAKRNMNREEEADRQCATQGFRCPVEYGFYCWSLSIRRGT